MLVGSGPLPADCDRFAFEVKWDGYRALIDAGPQGVTVSSRNGHDFTSRYPELTAVGEALSHAVLLDGEIVAFDEDGQPDFAALWFRTGVHQTALSASWPSTWCGSTASS
jgi:bifunctional non-homologous end joining protein LigD